MTKKRLLLKVVLTYPKEDLCKQMKQRHSAGWQEYICPHGPGGREPPSPDERCPFPNTFALVNGDWTLRKMNKAALARQKQVLPAETVPEPSVTITDGLSLVQDMESNDQTFSQHADSALTHILHELVRRHRIDVAFATYREDSIKNADISNRNIFQNMVPCHRIQQWRNCLSSSANKANLIRFLVVEW